MKNLSRLLVVFLVALFMSNAVHAETVTASESLVVVVESITETLLTQVAVALPLITALVSLVKYLMPDIHPQFTSLALSSVAYVVVVHIGLDVPFDSLASLVYAFSGVIGINLGANTVYEVSRDKKLPVLGYAGKDYGEIDVED